MRSFKTTYLLFNVTFDIYAWPYSCKYKHDIWYLEAHILFDSKHTDIE